MHVKSLVSILIPVYNRGSIIAETIQSAINQLYENIEVIIVDNASTDDTWFIIKRFAEMDSRVKVYRNKVNIGPVGNWLKCIEYAKGDYGKILWSDDLISPDFISKTLPLLKKNVAFVYTAVHFFFDNKSDKVLLRYDLNRTGHVSSLFYIDGVLNSKDFPVSPGCAIFRMDDIRKNLWLNIPNKMGSNFSVHAIGNDLLLFLLTANEYKLIGHVAEPLSYFRSHSGSITTSTNAGNIELNYSIVKAFFTEKYYPKLKKYVASQIYLLLRRNRTDSFFGNKTVYDFFNERVVLSKRYIFKKMIFKILRMSFYSRSRHKIKL